MRDIRNKLHEIDYQRKTYDNFVKQASLIITKLHEKFNHSEINIPTSDIMDNSFQFTFLGLNFITKTELLLDLESNVFSSGELNTYFIKDDNDDLILTYKFDYIGNIENRFVTEDFSLFYYVDLFNFIIKYSKSHKVKFQLK